MGLSAAILDAMVASGCTAEQIAAAVKAALADDERQRAEAEAARRLKNAERVRRHRERRNAELRDVTDGNVTDHVVTDAPRPPCPPSFPPDPLTTPLNPPTPDTRSIDASFDRFWKAYPRRDGANPRKPARDKFARWVGKGAAPEAVIAAADAYRRQCEDSGQIGTPYVAQAVTWLNQQRWEDYEAGDDGDSRTYPAAQAMLADETADVAELLRIRDADGWEAAERYAEQHQRRTA